MFMVEIDETRLLYTGDFSRQTDRHLMVAELPAVSPDVLIVESTYGKQVHEPREARERRFTESVSSVVLTRRGRCLLPVFALGRAQELLLILVRGPRLSLPPRLSHCSLAPRLGRALGSPSRAASCAYLLRRRAGSTLHVHLSILHLHDERTHSRPNCRQQSVQIQTHQPLEIDQTFRRQWTECCNGFAWHVAGSICFQ
jgi:hypothetical protein